MRIRASVLAFPAFAHLATATFNAYALYDHDAVANTLGISSECLSAL
jgi:hypothetical protein